MRSHVVALERVHAMPPISGRPIETLIATGAANTSQHRKEWGGEAISIATLLLAAYTAMVWSWF